MRRVADCSHTSKFSPLAVTSRDVPWPLNNPTQSLVPMPVGIARAPVHAGGDRARTAGRPRPNADGSKARGPVPTRVRGDSAAIAASRRSGAGARDPEPLTHRHLAE